RVLEARVLAVRAIAEIALHADDVLGDGERLRDGAEADDVADARVRRGLAVGRAHAAADDHVETGELPALLDGDEAEIVREDVDVVRRRYGERDLELARHVGIAVDR